MESQSTKKIVAYKSEVKHSELGQYFFTDYYNHTLLMTRWSSVPAKPCFQHIRQTIGETVGEPRGPFFTKQLTRDPWACQSVSLSSSSLVNKIYVSFYKITTGIKITYLYAYMWLHIYIYIIYRYKIGNYVMNKSYHIKPEIIT